jgi:hypothetical protein
MEASCPDCGGSAALAARTSRVFTGTCGGCGHTFMVVQDAPVEGQGSVSEGADEPTGGPRAGAATPGGMAAGSGEGPGCGKCGAALTLRASSDASIQGSCVSCGATFSYELARPEFPPSAGGGRREHARPERGPGFGPSRARPCRECGAPLRFSTGPDGTVTGECTSCGNRFTLPQRREFDRGGGPRDRRAGPGGGFSPRGRGPPSWQRRREGGGRPNFRSSPSVYRRTPRRDDDEDDDGDRRRRRPRRE